MKDWCAYCTFFHIVILDYERTRASNICTNHLFWRNFLFAKHTLSFTLSIIIQRNFRIWVYAHTLSFFFSPFQLQQNLLLSFIINFWSSTFSVEGEKQQRKFPLTRFECRQRNKWAKNRHGGGSKLLRERERWTKKKGKWKMTMCYVRWFKWAWNFIIPLNKIILSIETSSN